MKKMRTIDDRIIQALNTTIPTDSFASKVNPKQQCRHLYDEVSNLLAELFTERECKGTRLLFKMTSVFFFFFFLGGGGNLEQKMEMRAARS